jgi:ATP-dependent DNA helicase DinG
LTQRVADTLSNQGILAQAVPGFQPRQGQTDMALAVSRTVQDGGQLVVEAGTGTGKTYAYLVPVFAQWSSGLGVHSDQSLARPIIFS